MRIKFLGIGMIVIVTSACLIQSCTKNDIPKHTEIKELKSENGNQTKIMTFLFQPALGQNSEVIIDFSTRQFIFRNIYEFIEEPPPSQYGVTKPFYDPRKPLVSFVADLSLNEIENLNKLINVLKNEDYKRIEGNYTDGMACNFMIYDGKNVKNGFIAGDKTKNQAELQKYILNLLLEKNKFQENISVINYYFNF